MSSDGRIPIEQALPGAMIHPLDDDVRYEHVTLFVRTIDPDGDPGWFLRTTSQGNLHEVLGVLTAYCEVLRRDLADEWEF